MSQPKRVDVWCLLAVLGVLVLACGAPSGEATAPPPAAQASSESRPFFQGQAGQLGAAKEFIDFIVAHEKEIVRLDVTIEESDFDGSLEGDTYFVLWDDCAGLEPAEAPSSMKCSGWSYAFEAPAPPVPESTLHYFRGTYRVEGYFAVVGCSGPNQGLMGCTLRSVSIEEANS